LRVLAAAWTLLAAVFAPIILYFSLGWLVVYVVGVVARRREIDLVRLILSGWSFQAPSPNLREALEGLWTV